MGYEFTKVHIKGVISGDTFDRTYTIDDDFEITANTVIRADVYELLDAEPVLIFTTEDNSIVVNGQDIQLQKTAEQMNISRGRYYYRVRFSPSEGETYTIFGGAFIVK